MKLLFRIWYQWLKAEHTAHNNTLLLFDFTPIQKMLSFSISIPSKISFRLKMNLEQTHFPTTTTRIYLHTYAWKFMTKVQIVKKLLFLSQ